MTEHLQTTIDGREEPARAATRHELFEAPPLFDAPPTIRGQLALKPASDPEEDRPT